VEVRVSAHRAAALALALVVAACATLPPLVPGLAECRADFLGLDQHVDAADARNGGAHAIDGFPYLRSSRFLASFAREAADGPAFDAWVERLRRLDLQSRESELRNLGWDEPDEELAHLDRCGAEWAARDLQDPARRAALRERAEVPDDYSLLRRTLGLYPIAVPFLNLGISNFNEDVTDSYKVPIPLLDARGRPVLWAPVAGAPKGAPSGATVGSALVGAAHGRDPLGIPVLSPAQWQQLAATHAPTWQVEVTGEYDRIGTPLLREGDEPTVDITRPVTYFLPAYTRFGDRVLVQLVYVAWFAERPKEGSIDSYAGALDGVMWRVTLDEAGKPLLYDTIHACGCYHYYFLAQPLKRREQGGFWQEPVLFPQEAPAQPFAVRLQSGTHYVRRLVPLVGAAHGRDMETHAYSLADYNELLSLPDGDGGTRSLFCEDGIVCGTERFERFWLWPAGIKSAGAMRQWGRHATSFVGRSHFDDPSMMDRLFEP
jgi:hypothetical protein